MCGKSVRLVQEDAQTEVTAILAGAQGTGNVKVCVRGAHLTGLLRNRHKGSRGKQMVRKQREKKKANRHIILSI